MWANDHINEIHDLHDVKPQDLKFYDTVSIVKNMTECMCVDIMQKDVAR